MISIIGVGALGSHVVMAIRNIDRKIRVIDFDKVEQKNILAQFHTKMGLRKNKAQAILQTMEGLFNVKIDYIPYRLHKDNIAAILDSAELVIDCTDNFEARSLIHNYCKDRIPCLHGCLSADGNFARVIWTEDFVPDAEGGKGENTCVDGENLPFFIFTASVIASEIQNFFAGKKSSFQLTPNMITRLTV